MASGCPVAAARSGSLPEICGDAAVLFDPDDRRAVADAILLALGDAAGLVSRGFEQIRRFTWAACADRHVEVYREVARERRDRP
jgi:glycosyltransferase involved in cell wall biosynthesis